MRKFQRFDCSIGAQRFVRSGFTLVELLVSISIIAVLMSLILPAVQNSRSAARRTQCLNNLRNLGVAMNGHMATHDRFPAAGNWAGPAGNRYPGHNWAVSLLPYLDRTDIADRWNLGMAYNVLPNSELGKYHIEVFACPDDFTVDGGGDLSYGVASGIGYTTFKDGVHDCPVDPFGNLIDLNGNGVVCVADDSLDGPHSDREILKRLGLFFMENWGSDPGVVRYHTPASIYDGFSNTLMVVENVRTGYNPADPDTNWASPLPKTACVFYNPEVCPGNSCNLGSVNYAKANSGGWAINKGLRLAEGESPFASSLHTGGVNVLYADGHAVFLSEGVDGGVYAAFFSPGGSRLGGTSMEQTIPSDAVH
jgi:prepilin-type N-terminal cleavage/methylation domain-containing protein/prepilin-type processing-associated H-X9-DG protein